MPPNQDDGREDRTDGRRWIDLHLHSTASDGAFAPAKLMQLARQRGLSAAALTDHDTVAGLPEAAEAAEQCGLEFVPGIELAAEHARGTLHILAYFIDPQSAGLSRMLESIVRERELRNRRIVERLGELGITVDYNEIAERSGSGSIGRPHIAGALIRAGAARDMHDAFARYLGDDQPACVERALPSAETIIATIRDAGGAASLAHPSQLGCESSLELETLLRRLIDAGLDALEVRHPDHTARQTESFESLTRRFDLAKTGGSDFHALGPRHFRGVGFGRVRVPYDWLKEIRARRHENRG